METRETGGAATGEPDPELLASLVTAADEGRIVPWYQPLVDLDSGQVVALEALARWVQPDGTVRPTGSFILLAEESDLIVSLDHAVIERALPEYAALRSRHPGVSLSLNLSGRHLDRDDCDAWVLGALAKAGVAPEDVVLEFTEHKPPSDLDQCAATLTRLRDRGLRVWLDDFGSGWSGLQHLRQLPVDGVKLDTTHSRGSSSAPGEAVVRAVVTAAEAFGYTVTMEGIETEAQARQARALGCTYGQGFWWSPAVPPEELDGVLAAIGTVRPQRGQ